VAKSGTVFRVVDQKPVGHIKLNEMSPASIMSVSFDPIANNLYVVDSPYLDRGGMFVIDAKSFRQKKFLESANMIYLPTRDVEQQLGIGFKNPALNDRFQTIDRVTLRLGGVSKNVPQVNCLSLSPSSKRGRELQAEQILNDKFHYTYECFSQDGLYASQIFRTQNQSNSNGHYGFRQISVDKPSSSLSKSNIRAQEGECAMNTEKVICWPWRLSKRSRAELIDLATAQIHKVPFKKEDAPNGPADIFSVGKDYLVLQVGNNSTDFKYYIASDSTGWDLKPYDDLNKIKGEWLMNMYEIERR